MKQKYIETLQAFLDEKIDVSSYLKTLEDWNQSNFWQELSKAEYKLMSEYFRVYIDMYYGETIPKFNFWTRLKRNMKGLPDVDLQELKKGTSILLKKLPGPIG